MGPVKGKRLLLGENVEVRLLEEGLRGSWHPAVVIDVQHKWRFVECKELLSDDGKKKLVEGFEVKPDVDGLGCRRGRKCKNYRGRIRPLPPHLEKFGQKWSYGLCVDAFYDDAWWEGVLLDNSEDSEERPVFFPDEGDAHMIHSSNLRVTQVWDEKEGTWSVRGYWVLAILREHFEPAQFPIGLVWFYLRLKLSFLQSVGEWTGAAGKQSVWLPFIKQVVCHLLKHPEKHILPFVKESSKEVTKLAFGCPTPQTSSSSGEDMGLGVNCIEKELSMASNRRSGLKITIKSNRSHRVLEEANGADVKEQTCSSGRQNMTSESDLKEKVDCTDTEFLKDLAIRTGPKEQIGHIDRVLSNALVNAEGLKDISECIEKSLSTFPSYETDSKDQIECIDRVLLETSTNRFKDQIISKNGTELSQYCHPAGNYNLNVDKISSKEDRMKAKMCLVDEGWRTELKTRPNSKKFDVYFVSPTGHNYRSLRQAWSARENEQKLQGLIEGSHEGKVQSNIRNKNTKGSNSKKSGQGPGHVFEANSKKRKLNPIGSLVAQKREKGKSCPVKKKRRGPKGYRMQLLLSSPAKSKGSSSGQGKRGGRSLLSWMIENNIVLENQSVSYRHSEKKGWITCEGILCECCKKIYTLTNFEAHAGSKRHRPSANIILEDGRTLWDCQTQALKDNIGIKGHRAPSSGKKINHDACEICHFGGLVLMCDRCPNSFHLECINLENVPQEEPWYCPNCRCALCGHSEFNGDPESFTELTVLLCDQCERQYHVGCLYDRGMPKLDAFPKGNWFCSKTCSEIFSQLRNLVGMTNPVGHECFSWTLLRSTEKDGKASDPSTVKVNAEHHNKLCAARSLMRDIFGCIIEPYTKKDLVEEMIFNRGCDGKWLNVRGFYTMILEDGDNLVSVATVRIHGQRVAEMPLIGTHHEHRNKGMCRLLFNELEKFLHSLGVERLILPSVSELKQTWESRFGFQEMSSAERFELLGYNFMNFPDTMVLQKLLTRVGLVHETVTDAKKIGEAMHLSLGIQEGEQGIQEGVLPETLEISISKIESSHSEVAEAVTPIRSLPNDVCTFPVLPCYAGAEGCLDDKMSGLLLKACPHIDSTPLRERHGIQKNVTKEDVGQSKSSTVEDDLSKVVVTTTCSKHQVRCVNWGVHQINDRGCTVRREQRNEGEVNKRKRIEETSIDDKCPTSSHTDYVESSQHKDIQFGTHEIREPAEDVLICRKSLTTAEGNCLSAFKASAPVLDRSTFLEGGPNHVSAGKENMASISHTLRYSERYSENDYGHMSFKYFYRRRTK